MNYARTCSEARNIGGVATGCNEIMLVHGKAARILWVRGWGVMMNIEYIIRTVVV